MAKPPIQLIINADDYAYYPCISRGIVSVAEQGKLSATGILANSEHLAEQLTWLAPLAKLEIGVHLNLSYGQPVSQGLRAKFDKFASIYHMVNYLMLGKISLSEIETEWRAQIEACLPRKLLFLNSHEHIHMLPTLFPICLRLAEEYQIPYVRLTQAEWLVPLPIPALMRNGLIHAMALINRSRVKQVLPIFLGLSQSGQLNINYLAQLFTKLKPGNTYELMCHPGFFNPQEITDSQLIHYHHWEQERELLLSTQLTELFVKFNLQLGYFEP